MSPEDLVDERVDERIGRAVDKVAVEGDGMRRDGVQRHKKYWSKADDENNCHQ